MLGCLWQLRRYFRECILCPTFSVTLCVLKVTLLISIFKFCYLDFNVIISNTKGFKADSLLMYLKNLKNG